MKEIAAAAFATLVGCHVFTWTKSGAPAVMIDRAAGSRIERLTSAAYVGACANVFLLLHSKNNCGNYRLFIRPHWGGNCYTAMYRTAMRRTTYWLEPHPHSLAPRKGGTRRGGPRARGSYSR